MSESAIIKRLFNLDTASISDAMDGIGIFGALYDIKSKIPGCKLAGKIFTVKYEIFNKQNNIFCNAGNYIDNVPSGSVILIDNNGITSCTNWGDILTDVAIKNNIAGTVINGATRDINYIQQKRYPLFSKDITMVSGKNRVKMVDKQITLNINNIKIEPEDWLFGDDNGIIIIPKVYIKEVVEKAENVLNTENLIREAINNGMSLEKARKIFKYSEPWNLNEKYKK